MLVFSVLWDFGIFVGFAVELASGDFATAALFLVVPHTWVGVALAWSTVALWTNRTTVRVVDGRVEVTHGPLWWPGAVSIEAKSVDPFYVEISSVRVNKQARWNLTAVDAGGAARVVVPRLKSAEVARWIEQRLEASLGIVDRLVG